MKLLLQIKKVFGLTDEMVVRPADADQRVIWDANNVLIRGMIIFAIDPSIMHGLEQASMAAFIMGQSNK